MIIRQEPVLLLLLLRADSFAKTSCWMDSVGAMWKLKTLLHGTALYH
jgi:hypothetical protein